MRRMKKVGGYLVVIFDAREMKEYTGRVWHH